MVKIRSCMVNSLNTVSISSFLGELWIRYRACCSYVQVWSVGTLRRGLQHVFTVSGSWVEMGYSPLLTEDLWLTRSKLQQMILFDEESSSPCIDFFRPT